MSQQDSRHRYNVICNNESGINQELCQDEVACDLTLDPNRYDLLNSGGL